MPGVAVAPQDRVRRVGEDQRGGDDVARGVGGVLHLEEDVHRVPRRVEPRGGHDVVAALRVAAGAWVGLNRRRCGADRCGVRQHGQGCDRDGACENKRSEPGHVSPPDGFGPDLTRGPGRCRARPVVLDWNEHG